MSSRIFSPAFPASTRLIRTKNSRRCNCSNDLTKARLLSRRRITTSSRLSSEIEVENAERPRWQYTPPAMVAPVRLRSYKPHNEYEVNEDPRTLDQVYQNVLGRGKHLLLTEEVRWLAITHKSFDQGRRGYNDRLAFLGNKHISFSIKFVLTILFAGKRIVDLQTSLALLSSPGSVATDLPPDPFERTPFEHPSLDLLPQLNATMRSHMSDRRRLAAVAENYGLLTVLRWKPRKVYQPVSNV